MRISGLRTKLVTVLLLIFAVSSAWAEVEDDELRGRVLDVDVMERTLTLHLIEVGASVDEPVNSIQTYKIPTSVVIRDEYRWEVLPDTLDDIEEDEIVTVELDVEDRAMARGIKYDGQ
ncbi:MAG: hypothetical protein R3F50_19030 [Gammaproteobacteria bacterium]